jgi:hypothetical protein
MGGLDALRLWPNSTDAGKVLSAKPDTRLFETRNRDCPSPVFPMSSFGAHLGASITAHVSAQAHFRSSILLFQWCSPRLAAAA